MRTFDGNLDAYHALNAANDLYASQIAGKCAKATTQKEKEAVMREAEAHWEKQGKLYEELGEEMVKIMDVKWWQFWK